MCLLNCFLCCVYLAKFKIDATMYTSIIGIPLDFCACFTAHKMQENPKNCLPSLDLGRGGEGVKSQIICVHGVILNTIFKYVVPYCCKSGRIRTKRSGLGPDYRLECKKSYTFFYTRNNTFKIIYFLIAFLK